MSDFTVDPAALDAVAQRLQQAGAIDIGAAAPAPDAGEVSADVGAVLAHLVRSLGELAAGVTAAGDAVAAGAADYRAEDQAVARSLTEGG